MPKPYLAKAFKGLIAFDVQLNLCDRVTEKLSSMSDADVRSADSACSFFFIRQRAPAGPDLESLTNLRRAAVLLKKLFPAEASRIRPDDSECWDQIRLNLYVANFSRAVPTTEGMYLRGSFWAYANPTDRAQARAAWPEARRMIEAGNRAVASSSAASATLRARWFGAQSRTRLAERFSTLLSSMRHARTGLCYQGIARRTLVAGDAFHERGQGLAGVSGPLELNRDVGGSSRQGTRAVSLGMKFFNSTETIVRRSVLHDETALAPPFTRGGVMVHELTHLHLGTVDVPLVGAVRAAVVARWPAGGNVPAHLSAYGPLACHTLAQQAPDLALTNADNFRHFCEDALLVA